MTEIAETTSQMQTHSKQTKRADESFSRADIEAFITRRLGELLKTHAAEITAGVTTFEIRRERIRKIIIDQKFDTTIVGVNREGKPETFAALFRRFYSEPL